MSAGSSANVFGDEAADVGGAAASSVEYQAELNKRDEREQQVTRPAARGQQPDTFAAWLTLARTPVCGSCGTSWST